MAKQNRYESLQLVPIKERIKVICPNCDYENGWKRNICRNCNRPIGHLHSWYIANMEDSEPAAPLTEEARPTLEVYIPQSGDEVSMTWGEFQEWFYTQLLPILKGVDHKVARIKSLEEEMGDLKAKVSELEREKEALKAQISEMEAREIPTPTSEVPVEETSLALSEAPAPDSLSILPVPVVDEGDELPDWLKDLRSDHAEPEVPQELEHIESAEEAAERLQTQNAVAASDEGGRPVFRIDPAPTEVSTPIKVAQQPLLHRVMSVTFADLLPNILKGK